MTRIDTIVRMVLDCDRISEEEADRIMRAVLARLNVPQEPPSRAPRNAEEILQDVVRRLM